MDREVMHSDKRRIIHENEKITCRGIEESNGE